MPPPCVARDRFAKVLGNQLVAAGAPQSGLSGGASGSSASGPPGADTATTTTSSEPEPITSQASSTPPLEPANDNEPAVVEDAQTATTPVQSPDTLLVVDVPAAPAPVQSADATDPAPTPSPEAQAANNNTVEHLPATGTE